MATGTLSPDAKQTFLDTNGNPLVSGKLFTYIAGTTTAVATYTDVGLTVANANPIILDTAGRCVIFLSPGGSYKYVLQDSTGASIWTQDNISTIPSNAGNVDIAGIAGESITAGQAVYLSDGSGGKQAGQWYKGDSTNTYSSSLAVEVGMAPAAVASGSSGTMRASGSVSGLSVVTGTTYYIGTAGAITSSAPANLRQIGIADTTSTLVLSANPGIPNAVATVARGGTGAVTLTNHGVVLGQGTSAVAITSAGTSGQILTSNGASADPTFQSLTGVMTKLTCSADSGTDTSAGATTVATCAISGLTAKDRLIVYATLGSTTALTATPRLVNSTDSNVTLGTSAGNVSAGNVQTFKWEISQRQSSATAVSTIFIDGVSGTIANVTTVFVTSYQGSWSLGLRHNGVTATGTFDYQWAVYKLAGQ